MREHSFSCIQKRLSACIVRGVMFGWLNRLLTGRQKQCLSLWCFNCWSEREIGDEIGITHQAVHDHIAAAKRKFQALGIEVEQALPGRDVESIGDREISQTEVAWQF